MKPILFQVFFLKLIRFQVFTFEADPVFHVSALGSNIDWGFAQAPRGDSSWSVPLVLTPIWVLLRYVQHLRLDTCTVYKHV